MKTCLRNLNTCAVLFMKFTPWWFSYKGLGFVLALANIRLANSSDFTTDIVYLPFR